MISETNSKTDIWIPYITSDFICQSVFEKQEENTKNIFTIDL